jgi:hypothetical protein
MLETDQVLLYDSYMPTNQTNCSLNTRSVAKGVEMKWFVTVSLKRDGVTEIITIENSWLDLITDALDMVPRDSYRVLAVIGKKIS